MNAYRSDKIGDVYFQIGRLCYLILYFDPIEWSPLFTNEADNTSYFNNQLFSALAVGIDWDQGDNPFTYHKLKDHAGERRRFTYNEEPASLVNKIIDLPYAFFDSSIGTSSPNSSVCVGNATIMKESAELVWAQLNLQLFDKMGITLKRMLLAVDPISFACYQSAFEFY